MPFDLSIRETQCVSHIRVSGVYSMSGEGHRRLFDVIRRTCGPEHEPEMIAVLVSKAFGTGPFSVMPIRRNCAITGHPVTFAITDLSHRKDDLVVSSPRFSGDKRIPVDLESAGVFLAACTLKRVNGRSDLDTYEPDLFQHFLPGCTRQTTSDSSCPKIDVLHRTLGHGFAIRNIGELKFSTGT